MVYYTCIFHVWKRTFGGKNRPKTDHFGKKVRFPDFRRQTGPKYQLCLPLPMLPISKRRISIVESPGRFTAEVLLDMNNSVIEEANLNNSENRWERQASQGLLHSAARPSSMFAKTIQEVIQRPAKMPKLNNSNTMLVLNHAFIMNILIILLLQVLLLFSSVGSVPKLKLNSQFYLKFINNFAVFSVHYKINNSTFI